MSLLDETNLNKIKSIASQNGGMITTSQIEGCGISRVTIPIYIENGVLTKEHHGIYYCSDEFPDDMQILQKRSPKLIFSHGTALFLWDMSDRSPRIIDVSVPQGFNATHIKKDNPHIKLHYVAADKWEIGITKTRTPNGNVVSLYDKERCIIDMIKRKNKTDKQLYLQALHEYFSDRNTDKNKLLKYAKYFNAEQPVRDYMDILSH